MSRNSTVRLYKGVPLSLSSNDTRYFTSQSEQSAFFAKRLSKEVNYYSKVRLESGSVDVEVPISVASQCNYISIQNKDHENRTYYAYITEVEYVSDLNTRIRFQIDYMQTYMTDFNVSGTVEREHCDYRKQNTIPEEVDEGDLRAIKIDEIGQLAAGVKIGVIGTTTDLLASDGYGGGTLGSVNQPYKYYVVGGSNKRYHINGEEIMGIDDFFKAISKDEKLVNKIAFTYITDHNLFNLKVTNVTASIVTMESTSVKFIRAGIGGVAVRGMGEVTFAGTFPSTKTFSKSNRYGGDSAKLNYHPYTVYKLHTSTKVLEFKPELLPDTITVRQESFPEPMPLNEISIINYAGERDISNSVAYPVAANLPVVSEDIAVLMQHQTGIDYDRILQAAGLAVVGTVLTGGAMAGAIGAGVLSGIGSGVGEYMNKQDAIQKSKTLPNHETGTVGKLLGVARPNMPLLIEYTVTDEYKELLSSHFKKYGWKVLQHKKPNLKTRSSFNFVKMVDCVVKGNLPQSAISEISDKFREGVTFWHIDDIGNYSVSNNLL